MGYTSYSLGTFKRSSGQTKLHIYGSLTLKGRVNRGRRKETGKDKGGEKETRRNYNRNAKHGVEGIPND